MPTFVGWAPTVTGRLSFSRIGDAHVGDRSLCNNTSTLDRSGFLFGSETRVSRDGPFPALVMSWFGRRPGVRFVAMLEVTSALLPCATLQPSSDPDSCPVSLQEDREGSLRGSVIFFSTGQPLSATGREALANIRRLAAEGRSPNCSPQDRLEKFQAGRALSDTIWNDLVANFRSGRPTPGFGRVHVELRRTGECRLEVNNAELFTSAEAKEAQLASSGPNPSHLVGIARAAAAASRQTFFFIRDLAHHHYHHDAHSDLLTTTYPWTADSDDHWRRETQYGLVRMAIAARRQDSARKFKQALGVIAYADAFQKHLCGWVATTLGLRRSGEAFAYDFAALRQSIDASLKVRELKDAQLRQTYVFVFGFVVTCLGLVISGLHAAKTVPASATAFVTSIDFLTAHPFMSLSGAAVTAWAIDLAFIHLSIRPLFLGGWIGGLSRFIEAAMGSAMWRVRRVSIAYALGVLILLATIGATIAGSVLAYYWAFRSLGH